MAPTLACRVAENAPAMLVYLDADLRVRFANQHCYELLGRAPREILGRLLAELLDERTLRYALRHVAEVERGNGAPRDYVLRDRGGARKYVQIRAVADRDAAGRSIGYFACSADDSARRAVEQRLRHALAGAQAGMWEWDLGANEVHCSPEFSALLGYDAARVAADFSFFAALHPDDHAATCDALTAAIQDGVAFDREFRMLCADGGHRWLRAAGRALHDPDSGAATRFIGVARDICARKQVELELREARALAEATLEGCMELSGELDERRRLERVRRELHRAANHEVRTPLASIIAALELLREGAHGGAAQRESFLELALQNAEQLAAAVEQWLDLERIDLGLSGVRRLRFALGALVGAQVSARGALAAERGVRVEIVERAPVEVLGDPERLGRALSQLLAHAIARSPRGGTVRVRVGSGERRVVLLVEDEGADVPSDTDLGLRACRAIVERQGGSLQIANRAARGAAFHLELPCE
jgi:PAS domain S-box-containing protein